MASSESMTRTVQPSALRLSWSRLCFSVGFSPGRLHSTKSMRPPGSVTIRSGTERRAGLVNFSHSPLSALMRFTRAFSMSRSSIFVPHFTQQLFSRDKVGVIIHVVGEPLWQVHQWLGTG